MTGPDPAGSEFEEAYDDERQLRGQVFSQVLGDVPRRRLLTVPDEASIAEAVRAMNERHVGCALVVRRGTLCGIFTERDVLTKVAGGRLDPERTPVREVMTPDPDTLPESASIAFALQRMSVKGYRHVPLVDDLARPVGVVSVRDIVHWMVDLLPDSVINLPPEPRIPNASEGG